MQIITIESEVFQTLMNDIKMIKEKLNEKFKRNPLKETWLDNSEVCQLLHISPRTLQSYRDNNILSFTQHAAKIYYKASDIDQFLLNNYQEKKQKKK
jgi:hypothetical protein